MNVYTKKYNFLRNRFLGKALILLFVLVLLNFFGRQIRDSFYFVSYPANKFLNDGGRNISNGIQSFLAAGSLKRENTGLEKENQGLLSEIAALRENLSQDQALKEAVDNTKNDNFKLVLAKVVGLDTVGDFALVDKGSDDGITEGMPVISSQKVVYGKIFKAYKNFSQVMLISNKNNVLDVKIQSDDPAQKPVLGAVKGLGGLSVYLDLVSLEDQIKESDVLVTSGLDALFPADLPVGKIKSVDKNDSKPFQTAEVQQFFDIQKSDNLFIITNYSHN